MTIECLLQSVQLSYRFWDRMILYYGCVTHVLHKLDILWRIKLCVCVCYLPSAFGDGAQGHGLFDLSQRQHHSEAGQRGQPWVPHVVICEVVVRILAAQFG